MSYLFHAFLPVEPPPAAEAKAYLIEGALFDEEPQISIDLLRTGAFRSMSLNFNSECKPMTLRRSEGEESEYARADALDEAVAGCSDAIIQQIEAATVILEWEIEQSELDEDAWFALHVWQAWVLMPSDGILYAPGDGIFDAKLKRLSRTQ